MAHKKNYKRPTDYNKNVGSKDTQSKTTDLSSYKKWAQSLKKNPIIWIMVIAVLGASVYFQTYSYNYTQDDITYSTENSATKKGVHGIRDIFTHGSLNYYTLEPTNSGIYRPLTLLTFCMEFELFKTFNPKIGHLINVLLYFLVLLLIGPILVRLFSIKKLPLLLPLLILLLYALHPIHTEVVASIKSRETLLSAFFCIWSFVFVANQHRQTKKCPKDLHRNYFLTWFNVKRRRPYVCCRRISCFVCLF